MKQFREIAAVPNSNDTSVRLSLNTRLPQFIGAPSDADKRLAALKIAVIGCGSVGRNIALHLARLQITEVRLVDKGVLKPESLLTHMCQPEEVFQSQPKASNLGPLFKRINPATKVLVFDGPIEALDLHALVDIDVVVLATDNLLAEVKTAQKCLWLGIPLIQASVHGDTLLAHVRFFANGNAHDPCPVCSYSKEEWNALNRETRFSCEGNSQTTTPRIDGAPTMSTSFLCAMASDLAMVQVVRHALGLGMPVEDTMVEYCGFNHRTVVSPLKRNPGCPCEHTAYRRVMSPHSLPECTLRQLTETAGLGGGSDFAALSFKVGNLAFCNLWFCRCKKSRIAERFIDAAEVGETCPVCEELIRPQPFHTHYPVPASAVDNVLDRRLRDLGVASLDWAVVYGSQGGVLLYHN